MKLAAFRKYLKFSEFAGPGVILDLMKRTIFLYGLALAAMIIALKLLEYRFFVRSLSIEIYIGAIALLFTIMGIWLGRKLTRKKVIVRTESFIRNTEEIERLGISKRELEVLELLATGNSNQEIADKLFVSLNTVKTHTSNLFMKLNVKRRTQAIQKARELMLVE
jgi:DNA-binding CsgD family transcriptional regulator